MSFSSRHLRTAQVWSSLQIEQRTTTELCCGILRHWLDHRFQKTFNQVTSSSSHHQHVTPTQSLLSRSHNVTKGSQEVWLLWFNLSSPPLYFLLSVFLNFGLMNNFFLTCRGTCFTAERQCRTFTQETAGRVVKPKVNTKLFYFCLNLTKLFLFHIINHNEGPVRWHTPMVIRCFGSGPIQSFGYEDGLPHLIISTAWHHLNIF